MKLKNSDTIFIAFALSMMVSSPILMWHLSPSGDSTMQKRVYFAPINFSKCGNQVDIADTRPYSAMQLNLNPLEMLFYG